MSEQARYFRVGAFALSGIAAAVACAVALGANSLFDRPVLIETVFDESVQGLQVGSAVKLRGVEIGRVSEIGFPADFYDLGEAEAALASTNLVVVRMQVESQASEERSRDEQERQLSALVERGLRLQLTPLVISNTAFIQGEYLDPQRYPPLKISWTPDHLYVPSAPSTIAQLSSAADRLLLRINKLDVERLLTNLDSLLVNVNTAVTQADVPGLQGSFAALLTDLRETSAELRGAVRQAGVAELGAGGRQVLAELRDALGGLRQLLDASQTDLGAAFANLRVASEQLRDAAETARSYPSLLLFGQPPAPSATPPGEPR